jgi:uncharacterized membrane protein (UPF0127 family)
MIGSRRVAAAAVCIWLAWSGLAQADQSGPELVWVALGGETFSLELAADPETRRQGLSGRPSVPRNGGMLFVLPRPQPMAMVMRDCPAPIDVAFLDAEGRIVAAHEMQPEPPRRSDETPFRYEGRLHAYTSGAPVQFAVELAGGRLEQLGLAVGDRLALDTSQLIQRAT